MNSGESPVSRQEALAPSPLSLALPKSARGFAYIAVLTAVAMIAWSTSAAIQAGALFGRRDAEHALMTVGLEMEQALYSYAGVPWVGALPADKAQALSWRGPLTLNELLRDPRAAGIRRHLRRWRADPMTGRVHWGVVRDQSGYIVGFYSLAKGQPMKQKDFEPLRAHFEGADTYRKWVFGLPAAPLLALQSSEQSTPAP